MRTQPNCLWQSVFILCLGIVSLTGFAQSPACNSNPPKSYTLAAKQGEIYLPAASNGVLSLVRGGDTVKIPAGNYNDIILENFSGDVCNPVVIINSGGLVTTNYIRIDHGAQYFKLTGTGDSTIKYGFKVGAAGVGAGLAIGLGNHYEVANLECSNSDVGFLCKKNPNTAEPLTIYPNYLINTVWIHDNYIHNTHGEGMYIGHTYPLADPYNGNLVPIQMDSVQINNNIVDSTDWDGIQLSNAKDGAKIYNNKVTHFGVKNIGDQQAGIILGANTSGDIFNNTIISGTGNGMEVFGYGKIGIYNNLVVDAGRDSTANMQDAIFIDDRPMYNDPGLYIQAINNTIVNSGRDGIRMYNDRNSVVNGNAFYNNLIVQPNSLTTHASFTPYISFPNTLGTSGNNINLPTIDKAMFVNTYTGDYHLLAGSPAIDTGMDATVYGVIIDLDHFNRPYGLKYDAGAYEFTNAPAPPNRIPIAYAGVDLVTGLPNSSITLNGSGKDLDGVIIGYRWAQISGPSISSITNSTKAQTVVNGLALGTYQFELTVMDNDSATAKDTMLVTVLAAPPPNMLPVVNAGANQTITLPVNNVTVNGSASDPDGSISVIQWSEIGGPSTATIVNPSQLQTSITGLIAGTYTFQLKATDNSGGSSVSTMQVTVNPAPNVPPTVSAGSNQILTLPANTTKLTGSATDPDGAIASYQWTMISGPAACTISQGNAALTNVSGLVQGVYKFQLTATDTKGMSSQASVQVMVNPAPPVDGLTFKVSPNPATTVITVSFDAPLNGEKTRLIITDATGRIVYLEEFNRPSDRMIKEINVSTLMRGAYILNIDTGFDILTTKFLKN